MSVEWRRLWPLLAGMALGLLAAYGQAMPATADATVFLEQTERVRTSDHARFIRMLEQMHREAPLLTSSQRWYLRYLDAWQLAYQGEYAKAEPVLRDVMEHSGDRTLAAKSTALLVSNLSANGRYEEAYELTNRLVAELPTIKNKLARFIVLADVSQSLTLAGQHQLAINYARMMEDAVPSGESMCNPLSMQANALYNDHRLSSSSPELQRAIDACLAAGQPVFANTMWLVLGSLYLKEDHPQKALALLHRIAPSIATDHFYAHMLGLQVQVAQAYEKVGDDANARKAALAAVAMSGQGDINEWLKDAYEVLYRIEKKHGNAGAALSYYELAVIQDKGYLDEVSARALAYQMAQQHVLSRKLETEALSKQNNILRLQRALDAKAVETTRLYNLLLLVLIASGLLWLFRLKRSQLRFKKLSRQDSLTGILNHQNFVSQAGRTLHVLERRVGQACLVVFDLDHFKRVNDTHGHAMGDAVLKRAVAACQQQLRPSDLFGRLGGEEFGILLYECSRERGMEIANRVRAAIAEATIHRDDCVITVSASVGLAATDTSGYDMQRLCKEADAALYRAKRAGRNCVMGDIEVDIALARA